MMQADKELLDLLKTSDLKILISALGKSVGLYVLTT